MADRNFLQEPLLKQSYFVLGVMAVFATLFGVFYALFSTVITNTAVHPIFLAFGSTVLLCLLVIGIIVAIKAFKKGREISNYWALRAHATEAMQEYLERTTTEKLFISAIGFGTLTSILSDSKVSKNIAELIAKTHTTFEMTIVFPKNVSEWRKYRPDSQLACERIQQNIMNGHDLIKQFITNVKNHIDGMQLTNQGRERISIEDRLKLRCYNDTVVPRHFILQGDRIIFVGSYLSHNQGSDSYLLKLKQDESRYRYARLFDLFKNEITHITDNSNEITHGELITMTQN